MRAFVIAVAVLSAGAIGAGCATTTTVERVSPDVFVICDGGASDQCNGPNPEKGLDKACFAIKRTIAGIEEIHNNAILVTCGPRLRGAGER